MVAGIVPGAIDRLVDQEAELLRPCVHVLLHEAHRACRRGDARVARADHRVAAVRLGEHVEAHRVHVPLVLRLQEDDGVELVGRPLRPELERRHVRRDHGLDVRAISSRHETRKADPLHARIAARHLEPIRVRAETRRTRPACSRQTGRNRRGAWRCTASSRVSISVVTRVVALRNLSSFCSVIWLWA